MVLMSRRGRESSELLDMLIVDGEIKNAADLEWLLPQLTFTPISGPALTPFCSTDLEGVQVAYFRQRIDSGVRGVAVVRYLDDGLEAFYRVHEYDDSGNCEISCYTLPCVVSNVDRASWARAALATYVERNGGSSGDTATDIQDLICDLLHVIDEEKVRDPGEPGSMTPTRYAAFAVNSYFCESRGGEAYAVSVEVRERDGERELLSAAYV